MTSFSLPSRTSSTTFSNPVRNTTSFTEPTRALASYLLKEDGFELLTESGDKILLQEDVYGNIWTLPARN